MLKETEFAMNAIFRGDPTITTEQRGAALAILKGISLVEAAPMDRAMTRAEVAKLTGFTERTVTELCNRGLLRRLACPGSIAKGMRISGASVREYLNGIPAEGKAKPRPQCITKTPFEADGSEAL